METGFLRQPVLPLPVLPSLNLARARAKDWRKSSAVQTTEESIRLIETARTVELIAFSPDGDPLAMVPVAKSAALP